MLTKLLFAPRSTTSPLNLGTHCPERLITPGRR
jgi:hypothetical protein